MRDYNHDDVTRRLHLTFNGIATLYTLIFFFFRIDILLISGIVTILSLLMAYYVRQRGRVGVANFLLLIISQVAVFYHSLVVGFSSGIHTFFFSLAVIPFVVFQQQSKKLMWFSVLLSIVLWFAANFLSQHIAPFMGISLIQMQFTYLTTGVLNFLIIVFGLLLFSVYMNHYMQDVQNKNNVLEQKNRELFDAFEELKQSQAQNEQLAQQAAYAKLMKGIAHEIKNPMGILLNRSELVLTQLHKPEKVKLFADMVHRNVKRLNELTESMLKYQHDATRDRDVFDLTEMLQSIEQIISYQVLRAGLTFRNDIDPDLEAFGNGNYIHSAILNLIHNAIQYTKDGFILLSAKPSTMTCVRTGDLIDAVEIIVADSGEGISQENLEKIFTPYFSSRRSLSNMGLGLSLAYKTIVESDGTISVVSTIGEGTRFVVLLPQKETGIV